jgi:Restriction Enzyme Adenine Methylase Associated/Type I restriction enzyme R protein N terminus (HSDR_N)
MVSLPDKIKEKIERLSLENLSEADTKRVFIEPTLKSLGWDTEGIGEIKNEYRHKPGDNPVDYALLCDGRPILLIEAKALNISLNDRKFSSQLLAYANLSGVEWCCLTNGDEWRIYNSHALGEVEEKEFRRITISKDFNLDALELIAKKNLHGLTLKRLWDIEFTGRRAQVALRELLKNSDSRLIKLITGQDPHIDKATLKNLLPHILVSIDNLGTYATPNTLKPVNHSANYQPKNVVNTNEQTTHNQGGGKTKGQRAIKLSDLVEHGILKAGGVLEAGQHKKLGVYPVATVTEDSQLSVNGVVFKSPSAAACYSRALAHQSTDTTKFPTDGYSFWKFQGKRLDDYRRELAEKIRYL